MVRSAFLITFRLAGIFAVLVCLINFFCNNQVYAASDGTTLGIANYYSITDKKVSNGDIVSFSPQGYHLSNSPYDATIVGVITDNPAIAIEGFGTKSTYPVLATGDAYVHVNSSNGGIKRGDPITSSSTAGVGMKATRTGYIVGTALEDYSNKNTKTIGTIAMTINIHYNVMQSSVQVGVFDVLNLSTLATYDEPIKAFKYFIAAILVVSSFLLGFLTFGRTANKGLEAMGRNPLASRMIQVGMLINVTIAIVIVLVGLLVAFVVIRL